MAQALPGPFGYHGKGERQTLAPSMEFMVRPSRDISECALILSSGKYYEEITATVIFTEY